MWTLNEAALERESRLNGEAYRPYLENLRKLLGSSGILAAEAVKTYLAISAGVQKRVERTGGRDLPFQSAYVTFAAANVTAQVVTGTRLSMTTASPAPVRFDDYDHARDSAIRFYYDRMKSLAGGRSVREATRLSLDQIVKAAMTEMQKPVHKASLQAFRAVQLGGSMKGRPFLLEGIPEVVQQTKEERNKGLAPYGFEPTTAQEIVGEDDVKDYLETAAACVAHFDPKEQRNPYNRFSQYILLAGPPGTGKTMLLDYAATMFTKYCKAWGKRGRVVSLDFGDRYQSGPIENARHQLRQVSESNGPLLVSMDEMDGSGPAAMHKQDHMQEVASEMLRFRGGGGYRNKHNYLIIGTTNRLSSLHDAWLRVFDVKSVFGPQTMEERVALLHKRTKRPRQIGYLEVTDWERVGQVMQEADFKPWEIVQVADRIDHLYNKTAKRTNGAAEASVVEKEAARLLRSQERLTDEHVLRYIESQIQQRVAKKVDYV